MCMGHPVLIFTSVKMLFPFFHSNTGFGLRVSYLFLGTNNGGIQFFCEGCLCDFAFDIIIEQAQFTVKAGEFPAQPYLFTV